MTPTMICPKSRDTVNRMGATPENPLAGGCLCGAVRFSISAPAFHTHHCHCSICRKCQGALFPTFAFVNRSDFTITQGADHLATYHSSPSLHRHFCPTCGAHIYADADDDPDHVGFSAGTLDDGAHPGPDGDVCHIFWESRVSWYEPGDTLPRVKEYAD
jgi:hypothetical protein